MKCNKLLSDRKERRTRHAKALIASGEAERYTCDDSIADLPSEQLHNQSFGLDLVGLTKDVIVDDDAEVVCQTQRDIIRFGFGVVNALAELCDCIAADDDDMTDLHTFHRVLGEVIEAQESNRKPEQVK